MLQLISGQARQASLLLILSQRDHNNELKAMLRLAYLAASKAAFGAIVMV